jgi:post-segregation antitoxin (ccd killing protein)
MPKITVYVPDGLLERVRELNPNINISQVFQTALHAEGKRVLAERVHQTTVRETANMDAIRQKIQEGHQGAYDEAYAEGLKDASDLDYADYEELAKHLWNPDWVFNYITHEPCWDIEEIVSTPVRRRGYAAGLRDAWETAHAQMGDE